jgi:hypothetical protein
MTMNAGQIVEQAKALIIGLTGIVACILAGVAVYKIAQGGFNVSAKDAAEIAAALGIAVYTLK